jgi:hypothetical protein
MKWPWRSQPSSDLEGGDALLGRWRLIADGPETEAVTLDFKSTGDLAYTLHAGDKLQIMNLSFRLDGDCLVTNQASRPREERTRYAIGADGVLRLEFDGKATRYERAS